MSPEHPTVYVVDDDVSVREALKNLLRSVGLKVVTFDSADKFLSTKPATAPSCLIVDVRLPGLSGLDLQRQLAQTNHEIPIVFITGHGDIPMSVRAIKAGAVEFLTKPFRDQDLLDAMCGDSLSPTSSPHTTDCFQGRSWQECGAGRSGQRCST